MPEPTEPTDWDWSRPVFDHVHLRVADLGESRRFYATVLAPLKIPLLHESEDLVQFANLALSTDRQPSERAHLAFMAEEPESVDAFHEAGVEAGYVDNGAPGERADGQYAAYLLDPDGHNVEAIFRG